MKTNTSFFLPVLSISILATSMAFATPQSRVDNKHDDDMRKQHAISGDKQKPQSTPSQPADSARDVDKRRTPPADSARDVDKRRTPPADSARDMNKRHTPPPPDRNYDKKMAWRDRDEERDHSHRTPPRTASQYPQRNGKWAKIADLYSGGEAKEVSLNGGGYKECKIEVVEGNVGFKTIVVRRDGEKQSLSLNTVISKKTERNIPIDFTATGIRISENAGGRYKIWVR